MYKGWENHGSSTSPMHGCQRALDHGIFFVRVNWVMLKGIMELLASWKGNFNMGNNVGIWGISHCLMWGIWWEQNAQTFERCERSVDDLKLLFLKTLLE